MKEQDKKFFDLEKIIRDKNPRLSVLLPRFVIRWLRGILHEDEVNAFIVAHGHKKGIAFAETILQQFDIRTEVTGLENIPASGGFILVANHPLGGLDAMSLFKILSVKRTDMKFLVNDILLRIENLSELFVGINKHGRNTQKNLETVNTLYASEQAVLVFPAGLVSRKQNGVVRDLEWKKSFVTRARKHHRTVIPVHVSGRLTNRFYRLANWRRRLGIKANIEMFLLVDELFRQRKQTLRITIHEPIAPETFDSGRSDSEWAALVRDRVYENKE